MTTVQLSFLPDNDVEPRIAKPSVPVAKLINGRWCWKRFGEDVWEHEPELEKILLEAQARRSLEKAA